MKKKLCYLLFSLVAIASFACCAKETEHGAFIKAAFTIDVELKYIESTMNMEEAKGITTAIGSGTFAFDFCFEDKAEPETLVTEGTYQLQHYEPLTFGSDRECIVTLEDVEYKPKKAIAQCYHKEISDETTDDGKCLHELQFRIPNLPSGQGIIARWDCGGISRIMPDPALPVQIYLPLFQEAWNFTVPMDETRITTRHDIPLHLGLHADVTFGITLTKLGKFE